MQAFADCALLYDVVLTWSNHCPQTTLFKSCYELSTEETSPLSKLTDGGDKLCFPALAQFIAHLHNQMTYNNICSLWACIRCAAVHEK